MLMNLCSNNKTKACLLDLNSEYVVKTTGLSDCFRAELFGSNSNIWENQKSY